MTDKGETDNNNGGQFRRETIHHQHRRSYWHDYHELGLYMLTMVIEGRQRLFGTIVGSAKRTAWKQRGSACDAIGIGTAGAGGRSAEDTSLLSDGGGMAGGFHARSYPYVGEGECSAAAR